MVMLSALALCACASNSSAPPTTVVSVPQSNIVVLTTAPTSGSGGTTVGPGVTVGSNPATAPVTPPVTEPPVTTAAATTEPPVGPVVTIIQGGFNSKASGSCGIGMCKYVDILMSGFAKGESLSIMCYSNHGSSGPYVKTADKTGSFHSTTACFFGNVTNVYVTVNDIKSNVVSPWKDW